MKCEDNVVISESQMLLPFFFNSFFFFIWINDSGFFSFLHSILVCDLKPAPGTIPILIQKGSRYYFLTNTREVSLSKIPGFSWLFSRWLCNPELFTSWQRLWYNSRNFTRGLLQNFPPQSTRHMIFPEHNSFLAKK